MAKSLQPAARVSHAALSKALDSLEEAAGGRQGLVARLLHAPETPEQQFVIGLLADPRSDALNLSKVCEQGKISLGQLIHLLKEAKASEALLKSMDRIAAFLPDVAEDVMVRSVPHLVECAECWGEGRVQVELLDEKGKGTGETEEKACGPCRGTGKVKVLPTLERQKVALEIGGLLKKQSGVTVNVSQQAATFNFGSDARKDFRSATDALLYRKAEAPAVEAEVVEGGDAAPSED